MTAPLLNTSQGRFVGALRCGRFTPPQGAGFALELGRRTLVMGILNVTPDSFSDGGRYVDAEAAVRRGCQLAAEGADLIDIGGESTRPGAVCVSAEEELRRVVPVVEQLAPQLTIPISIDTSKAIVARRALAAGASLINDVTALQGDPAMGEVVAQAGAPVVLMHMQGAPQTMQRAPYYHDVVVEVGEFFEQAMARAVSCGIGEDRCLLDPGLGFGKTVEHNLMLLAHLDTFHRWGRPLVVGPSRKSFLGRDVKERLPGTIAACVMAAQAGAQIVRVHDVAAVRDALQLTEAVNRHD